MRSLVIDKSFAQSISIERLHDLADRFHFLVPSAFYYEMFDTQFKNRRMAARGFPNFQRIHLPELLRQESEKGVPIQSVEKKVQRFSSRVVEEENCLDESEQAVVDRHADESVEPRIDFWMEVADSGFKGFPGFSEEEVRRCVDESEHFAAFCTTLRAPYRIRRVAEVMGFKHASLLNERWLYFRFFQVWMLQGLIICRRYSNPANLRSRKNVEHDVQDMEYLTLGLHCGALATRETSAKFELMPMKWRFNLLEPTGLLLSN